MANKFRSFLIVVNLLSDLSVPSFQVEDSFETKSTFCKNMNFVMDQRN